ncbi:TIGR03086 family protein [Lentzea tibetensis]|uniref:TIGR03086 family protein n=1 Tax=Lentzea tibetensis TaxID=2591470 RepID=A0A563EWJ5_9PSEU|nr:TIGR03086 family metal-binding protein [Lentzea tibetensis]TWP51504.1 TIGR03086 family protein [Lentzea tibetensis]
MDLRALNRQALDVNLELIATIRPDQYELRTPCAKWNIGELLQHLVDSTYGFAGQPADGSYADAAEAVTRKFNSDGYLDEVADFGTFGKLPGSVKVGVHLVDTVVHAWDLNRALGRPADLDPVLAQAALKLAERLPDTPQVRGPEAAFNHPVQIADDASLTDRLIAMSGRTPTWA